MLYIKGDCSLKKTKFNDAKYITETIRKLELKTVVVETGNENIFIQADNKFIVTKELLQNKTYLFAVCSTLQEIDLTKLDFSEVTTMGFWFDATSNLKMIKFPEKANCKMLQSLYRSFSYSSINSLDLSFMETGNNLIDVQGLLMNSTECKKVILPKLTVDSFSNVFEDCNQLKTVIAPVTFLKSTSWSTRNNLFYNCFKYCYNLKLVDFSDGVVIEDVHKLMNLYSNLKNISENCVFVLPNPI